MKIEFFGAVALLILMLLVLVVAIAALSLAYFKVQRRIEREEEYEDDIQQNLISQKKEKRVK